MAMITSCSKPSEKDFGCPCGPAILPPPPQPIPAAMDVCDPELLSPWVIQLSIDGSGDNKLIIKNTNALRTMAYTGAVGPLDTELSCNYSTSRGGPLRLGHKSDVNRIGFASQLKVEHYIIAMYHPNNYPDHFIIYNLNNQEWWRYDHSSEEVWLSGTGD